MIGVVFTITLRIVHLLDKLLFVIILKDGDSVSSQISDKLFLAHIGDLRTIPQRYFVLGIKA